MPLQLETDKDQFEELWRHANRHAANVTINRLTLFRLLVDHAHLIKAAHDAGWEVEEWPVIRKASSR